MQILGKLFLLLAVVCLTSTAYGKEKTVKDTVVEQATQIKDNVVDKVSDGVKKAAEGVKVGSKVASDAAKTAGMSGQILIESTGSGNHSFF